MIPPPPPDTLTLAVEVHPEDLHLVDNIFQGHDHIAQVRWNRRLVAGRPCYLILVPPDFLEETQAVLERLKRWVRLGRVTLLAGEGDAADEGR